GSTGAGATTGARCRCDTPFVWWERLQPRASSGAGTVVGKTLRSRGRVVPPRRRSPAPPAAGRPAARLRGPCRPHRRVADGNFSHKKLAAEAAPTFERIRAGTD